jgi:hypothetical protein
VDGDGLREALGDAVGLVEAAALAGAARLVGASLACWGRVERQPTARTKTTATDVFLMVKSWTVNQRQLF